MKKKQFYLCLLICGVSIAALIVCGYHYYDSPKLRQQYQLSTNHDDTLHIAYIGDSWAFMHNYHECKIAQLLNDTIHQTIRVHSFGTCGLTSKEIYENLFNDSKLEQFFQKRTYNYCFISAGINDTYKKMSTSYYKTSMDGIIQFLLANQIYPIIFEIPDYNIQKAFAKQTIFKLILRRISMFITETPIDSKQQLRNSLNELIIEKGYTNRVSVIRYKTWNKNYVDDQRQLYQNDGMHLNAKGYDVIDSIIAIHVADLCNTKHMHR